MPKIVDREKYRNDLAVKATKIFREYGYSGLGGMRKIADELGISKTALYHYFPSKEALFAECTKIAVSFEQHNLTVLTETAGTQERVKALIRVFENIEAEFKGGELTLLLDYIRMLTPDQTANDANMQIANQNYLKMTAEYVGHENAEFVLCLMYGVLLKRLLDGQKCSFHDIEKLLITLLDSSQSI